MTCFIDRICEQVPELAWELVVGQPEDAPDPVVIVADKIIPRASVALLDGTAPAIPYRLAPWPVTIVEMGKPRNVPDVVGDLAVASRIGWIFSRGWAAGTVTDRMHASLYAEAGTQIHGPIAELELDAGGLVDLRPTFLSLTGTIGSESEDNRFRERIALSKTFSARGT
jgi:hypothetical protein